MQTLADRHPSRAGGRWIYAPERKLPFSQGKEGVLCVDFWPSDLREYSCYGFKRPRAEGELKVRSFLKISAFHAHVICKVFFYIKYNIDIFSQLFVWLTLNWKKWRWFLNVWQLAAPCIIKLKTIKCKFSEKMGDLTTFFFKMTIKSSCVSSTSKVELSGIGCCSLLEWCDSLGLCRIFSPETWKLVSHLR